MSNIRQWQREAIEELRPQVDAPLMLSGLDELFLENRRLYPLGISNGIGTCARVKGMDVLVLGLTPRRPDVPAVQDASSCLYAVLLRGATEEERRAGRNCNSALDLLRVKEEHRGKVTMERAGHTSLYCALV